MSKSRFSAHARQPCASLRARLLDPAPLTRGSERAPAPYLDDASALPFARRAKTWSRGPLCGAGTVEFLMMRSPARSISSRSIAHPGRAHRTEVVTGLDIVKAQIRIAKASALACRKRRVYRRRSPFACLAMPCSAGSRRKTLKTISYPIMAASPYRGAMGFGIRIDGRHRLSGAVVTRFYIPCSEKSRLGPDTRRSDTQNGSRASRNIAFGRRHQSRLLHKSLTPRFIASDYTTRFHRRDSVLIRFQETQGPATKLLTFIRRSDSDGHPETKTRTAPPRARAGVPNFPASQSEMGRANY